MSVTYNVVRDDGVFIEGMTKEQIIAAIAEATGVAVSDIDSAFITKIKEINHQNAVRIWMGTNAEYNAITEKSDDVLYVITDDTFVEDTSNELINLDNKIDANNETMEDRMDEFEESMKAQIAAIKDKIATNPVIESEVTGESYGTKGLAYMVSFDPVTSGSDRTATVSATAVRIGHNRQGSVNITVDIPYGEYGVGSDFTAHVMIKTFDGYDSSDTNWENMESVLDTTVSSDTINHIVVDNYSFVGKTDPTNFFFCRIEFSGKF